ncbi:MAG: hypothetical protein H7346_24900 [Burkholderiaceae bacterium]|nr:hypothetical protein [Burkholderiaceae bacterium]
MSTTVGRSGGSSLDASVQRYAFVAVKAFGDLTVTAAMLRCVPEDALARCSLLIGPHLGDLSDALKPVCNVDTLPLPDHSVPAIFDLKKRGLVAGLHSALTLRSALATAAVGSILVMPRPARREAFIAGRRFSLALPPANNVYVAHERFLLQHVTTTTTTPRQPVTVARPRRIALCPFSRVAAKNIPAELVIELAEVCDQAGFAAELLLLEGEHFEHPDAPPSRVIQRRFDALADALVGYAGMISADSLPAHLAEYCGTPAFVASPVANPYWLPAQAFKGEYWGLFDQRADLTARLQRFLDNARP